MNYSRENARTNFNSDFHLDEEFSNLTLQNEPPFEYEEVGEDRVLYCAQHELLPESFVYTEPSAISLDTTFNSAGSWAGWECSPEVKDTVIAELGPEEVRWFYKGESDKRWIEFSGYDSLRIEFKYRQLYHECNLFNNTFETQESTEHNYFENTLSDPLSALNVRSDQTIETSPSSSIQFSDSDTAYSSEPEHHSIVVRGGMYEVDLKTWKCDSIYWPDESHKSTSNVAPDIERQRQIIENAWYQCQEKWQQLQHWIQPQQRATLVEPMFRYQLPFSQLNIGTSSCMYNPAGNRCAYASEGRRLHILDSSNSVPVDLRTNSRIYRQFTASANTRSGPYHPTAAGTIAPFHASLQANIGRVHNQETVNDTARDLTLRIAATAAAPLSVPALTVASPTTEAPASSYTQAVATTSSTTISSSPTTGSSRPSVVIKRQATSGSCDSPAAKKGEECIITRGVWFYGGTWQPLEAERSEALETIHLQLFYGHRHSDFHTDPSNRTQKTVLHRETFPELYVEWYSPTEVYLYSEAAPSKLVRTFTQKLGFQKSTGYRLYRGYRSYATETDRPVDINHLVFVIHGIGQKMDTGRIIRNTSAFRGCVEWLKKKFFPSSDLRVEFFPVEWRSSLKLDGDIVEAITPHKLVGLRQLLNSSAMDIMYYTSPVYGTEIQRGLSEELNKLYSKFTQRNPYFTANGGKISVIAHSLGCVIVYDIVTGWHPGSWQMTATCPPRDNQTQQLQSSRSSNYAYSLNFQIENLFCIGSPLSVFLALRWQDLQAAGVSENILPPNLCKYFYNIFHPSDPVAYRMEPLIMREYSRIAPLQIHAYNSSTLVAYSDMPLEPVIPDTNQSMNVGNPSIALMKRREGVDDTDSDSPSSTPSKERSWSIWGLMRGKGKMTEGAGSPPCDSLPPGLDHRLDYVLRETNIGGSYLSALTSHTTYWNNYDVAHFVLTRIFPTLEAQRIQQLSSSSQQAQTAPSSGSPEACK